MDRAPKTDPVHHYTFIAVTHRPTRTVNGRPPALDDIREDANVGCARNATPDRPRVFFVTDFYVEEVLLGVVNYARDAGWELNANMRFHGRFPLGQADGILATVTRERVREWLAGQTDCRIVQLMSSPIQLPYPVVRPDYTAAGRAGARHLMELGHVHFAFHSLFNIPDVLEVRDAFEAELWAAGRRPYRIDFAAAHPGIQASQVARSERESWLANQLLHLPRPIAVMGDDDRRALELEGACQKAGLRVPEDVAILGCDNLLTTLGMARIPLSSVDMNFRSVGREGAAMLDGLMRGDDLPSRVVKPAIRGVMARQSTATFVTDSPAITAAVTYLRENFSQRVRVQDLARRAGLSTRVFELEFKRHIGRSARQELQRTRLACAARLLRDTDLKIDAIAVESGFRSASKLCATFAKVHGVSPNAWRLRVNC